MAADQDDKQFTLTIRSIFTLTRRGIVVVGPIEAGVIMTGDQVEIWDGGQPVASAKASVEFIRDSRPEPGTIALRLQGLTNRDALKVGQTIHKQGSRIPAPSEMDLAVRAAVLEALHPYEGLFSVEFPRAGDMWWIEVQPRAPRACSLSVAFDGGDTLYWSIGRASIEVFSVGADYIPCLREIVGAVAEGHVEETGLRSDASIRVRSDSKVLLAGGPMRIPWPRALRRVRRYVPFGPPRAST